MRSVFAPNREDTLARRHLKAIRTERATGAEGVPPPQLIMGRRATGPGFCHTLGPGAGGTGGAINGGDVVT